MFARRLSTGHSSRDAYGSAAAQQVEIASKPELDNPGKLALAAVPKRASVSLRYVRTAPLRVVGEVSRQQYEFSGSAPIQTVDSRDLLQLLSLGYFSRA